MTEQRSTDSYFPRAIQISARSWSSLDLGKLSSQISKRGIPKIIFYRQLSLKLNQRKPVDKFTPVHAGHLNLFATLQTIYRYIIDVIAESQAPGLLVEAVRLGGFNPDGVEAGLVVERFVQLFPPDEVLAGTSDPSTWLNRTETFVKHRRLAIREVLLLSVAAENPAIESFREILDDRHLAESSPYRELVSGMDGVLSKWPLLTSLHLTLLDALRAPI
ncbi:MAG: alpha-amylase, partial [Deltaproteobacteria bacterium]